jgi:hypothetical protein
MQAELPLWRFFRAGGFDQVRLETAQELLAIGRLDQKLWVALSCPVKGLEFDAATLACIDSDGDGHVRAPDLIAAVEWADSRLSTHSVLEQGLAGVPLSAIAQDDVVGQQMAVAAREVLADIGSADGLVTVEAATAAQGRFAERAQIAWETAGLSLRPLGDATEAAYAALAAVQDKVDDWFVRCSLLAFDTRASDALNASAEAMTALGAGALSSGHDGIIALPLSQVTAHAALPLDAGLNPAWAAPMDTFKALVVEPLLGARATLSAAEWQHTKQRFAAYAEWLLSMPDPTAVEEGVRDLEKLARYVRDLMVLANNFVAFRDFYDRKKSATFQVGTLYLDTRSCDLCVAVNDAAKHTALASLARICLIYVDCTRGAETLAVAAAMTAGDADQLMVGRNGVFYDRQGRDWNATITRIVDHPISLRQAFWSPYKRLARLVSEQMQKMAASKAKASEERLGVLAGGVGVGAGQKPAAPAAAAAAKPPSALPAPFDVARFAGIFAAIGLAVGALGTALASMVGGLFALKWWQIPIALLGLLLLVSGPAVLMAWFKLRSRNLGPILDANGWAINARARINIPFGTSLTKVAVLPANAQRSLTDPYAEPSNRRLLLLAVLLALALALGLWRVGWLAF